MNRKIKVHAFGKANLSLNITGKRDDGMHELDSVMMSIDCFDTVTVAERDDETINVVFTDADIGENNTAYKAAHAVQKLIGGGWDIEISKGIPVGGGLGGSSADGAAVIRALDLMYGLSARGISVRALALSVGSDVPFMLTGGLARVRGVGDDLFFIENKLELWAIGLMAAPVSTARAYAKFDEMYEGGAYCPTDTDAMCKKLLDGDNSALEHCSNALYAPAVELSPNIEKNVEALKAYGAHVTMSGSGGTVIGFFTDMREFIRALKTLCKTKGYRVFAPARTGLLHEWIAR